MMAQYPKKIIEAIRAVSEFIVKGAGGMPPMWPFSIIEINWYHSKFLPKEIVSAYRDLKRKSYKDEEISEVFWGPSAVTHWLYIAEHALGGKEGESPFEGLSVRESQEFLEKTVDLISLQRKEDIFCRDFKNIVLGQKEVAEILNEAKFISVSDFPRLAKNLAEVNTILWHYCILIQVAHRAYSQEFHGPYSLENGETLFVRDYFNLKPTPVWNFTENFPFEDMRILEIYKNLDIKVDVFNHYEASAPFSTHLQRFAIFTNNRRFLQRPEEIQELSGESQKLLKAGNDTVKDFGKEDWIEKIIEMRYFWLKPAKEILNKDWKPVRETYNLKKRIKEAETAVEKYTNKMKGIMGGFFAKKLSEEEAINKITRLHLKNIYRGE